MAALGSPARTLRGLLRELRYLSAATGRPYRDTAAYRYLVKAFRAHRVTSEKLCRAQHELHFQAATYLCLLRSIREHVALHQEFHGKGYYFWMLSPEVDTSQPRSLKAPRNGRNAAPAAARQGCSRPEKGHENQDASTPLGAGVRPEHAHLRRQGG
uniref:Protein FMC1 homolog n=1 Tax=Macaca fascicularis TaxID=9541 RepID=G8F3T3_MACFA